MNDKIFLLSKEEYENYKDKIPLIKTYWWLRTTKNPAYAYIVNYNRFIDEKGQGMIVGVRPAIHISEVDKIVKASTNVIIHAGVTWSKIDNDLYIAETPIAFKRFNKNYSEYKASAIRKFLLHWYNERKGW